jgi:hypothetical protein
MQIHPGPAVPHPSSLAHRGYHSIWTCTLESHDLLGPFAVRLNLAGEELVELADAVQLLSSRPSVETTQIPEDVAAQGICPRLLLFAELRQHPPHDLDVLPGHLGEVFTPSCLGKCGVLA